MCRIHSLDNHEDIADVLCGERGLYVRRNNESGKCVYMHVYVYAYVAVNIHVHMYTRICTHIYITLTLTLPHILNTR